MIIADIEQWERDLKQQRVCDALDRAERDATRWVAACETMGDTDCTSYRACVALLAVLPVVRLASKYTTADLAAPEVVDAIDDMRKALERKQ